MRELSGQSQDRPCIWRASSRRFTSGSLTLEGNRSLSARATSCNFAAHFVVIYYSYPQQAPPFGYNCLLFQFSRFARGLGDTVHLNCPTPHPTPAWWRRRDAPRWDLHVRYTCDGLMGVNYPLVFRTHKAWRRLIIDDSDMWQCLINSHANWNATDEGPMRSWSLGIKNTPENARNDAIPNDHVIV